MTFRHRPSRFEWLRTRISPTWRGSRGLRLASPTQHAIFFVFLGSIFYHIASEDRTPPYVAERPQVPAPPPPPGVMSFEASCEMNYRMGKVTSGLTGTTGVGGLVRPVQRV
jgi:hypothetical protein